MEPERWREIERLYHAALERDKSQRATFIQQACSGDIALEQEVQSLLAQSEGGDSFLEAPALEVAAKALAMAVSEDLGPGASTVGSIPPMIGRYRIISVLGEGGMGTVYEAEQEHPRRIVALKVIKPGYATPEHLWRFEHESKALGRLQHPGIAQIYEASTADTGFGRQPYFAMELIRGQPLLAYADGHQLSARQKLALVARICDAIEHAHQRGLIHRDLKPGNIVVDDTGQPKILDFGVARVTEADAQPTRQTNLGQIVGTLAYMSPEQVLGDPQEVDTRSDVYSLGVILYELLAGRLPYDVNRRQLHEAVHTIREEDPTTLSSISRNYRGDIETIVGKALEKDKARRYASAADLAADIRRYLNDEPITARPPTASYQLRKFVRRHRLGVTVAAILAVLLVGFAGVQAVQLRRITSERDRANRERDRANRVTTFMTDMFKVSDPSVARGNTITAREILDKASKEIDTGLDRDPELKAQMMDVMGTVYERLGLYSSAHPLLERSADIQRRVLGPESPETLVTMHHLALNLFGEGRYTEAEKSLRETLDIQRRVLGPDNLYRLLSMTSLANVLDGEGRYPEAEKLDRETLDIRRRVLGPEHSDTLSSMENLAQVLAKQGRYAEAEKLDRETLDIRRRVSGLQHPETLGVMNNLALILDDEGRYPESEKLDRETLDIQRRVMGPEHPYTLLTMSNLANTIANQGRYAEAEKLLRETLDIQRRVLGPEHPYILLSMNNLATILDDLGRYAEAAWLERETLDIRRRVSGPEHPETVRATYNLACFLARDGRRDEALSLLQEVVDHRLPPDIQIQTDPDLKSLHGTPRFDALIAQAKARAAAAR